MAGVAQLVELWIVIPMSPSDISDLSPKTVWTSVDISSKCRQSVDKVWTKCGQSVVKIKDRIGDFTWRVSDCEELVSHQIEHLSIYEANYFMYQWAGHAMRHTVL